MALSGTLRARRGSRSLEERTRCRAGDHDLCDPATPQHGTCSRCGHTVRVTRSSAPPEKRRCRDCRNIEPVPYGKRVEPEPARPCELCETPYVPGVRASYRYRQRFCSRSCATAWRNGARPPYTRRYAGDAATRHLAKSRARHLRHAQTWDGITDAEILERDGWRCQIPGCKRRPIRKDVAHPHPRSKSIDHIIPLSLGGDDTAVNKRAAHLRCNVARSANVGHEQLALFGVIREPPLMTVTASGRMVERPERWPSCPVFVRDCVNCGKPFTARRARNRYCSGLCRRRAVAGVRSCQRCGQQFDVILGGRKRLYCSDSCCTRAYQLRKAAA